MTVTIADYDVALERFLETLGRIGAGLQSVVLHGSMACGTVKPGWSDVMDAHVVLGDEVFEDRETYLAALAVMLDACQELEASGLPFHPFGYLSRDELSALHLSPFYTFPFEPYSRTAFGEDLLSEIRQGPASRELARTYFFEARHAAHFHLARFLGKPELTDAERAQLITVLLSINKSLVMACAALGVDLVDIRKLDIVAQLETLVPGLDASVIGRIEDLRGALEVAPETARPARKARGSLSEEGARRSEEAREVAWQALRFVEALHDEIVRRRRDEATVCSEAVPAAPTHGGQMREGKG